MTDCYQCGPSCKTPTLCDECRSGKHRPSRNVATDVVVECIKAFDFDDISLRNTKPVQAAMRAALRRARELWGLPPLTEL